LNGLHAGVLRILSYAIALGFQMSAPSGSASTFAGS
jgi:hypothetical protein